MEMILPLLLLFLLLDTGWSSSASGYTCYTCEVPASSGPCGDRFSNVTAVGGCAACTKERRWLADGQTRILRGCYQDQTQLSGDLGSGCKRCLFALGYILITYNLCKKKLDITQKYKS